MPLKKLQNISLELKRHVPFTLLGTLTGIALMLFFSNMKEELSHRLFYIFHPAHVLLSAIVASAMFELHSRQARFFLVLLVGFAGSIGLATVSDSLIPYFGELLLGMQIHTHGPGLAGFAVQAHIGFIEGWYIVVPAGIMGILIGYIRPRTKLPHAGHVLVSTWASSFHMLMALAGEFSVWKIIGSFAFLFLAVWLPCCASDIVFPLLFVKSGADITESMEGHWR